MKGLEAMLDYNRVYSRVSCKNCGEPINHYTRKTEVGDGSEPSFCRKCGADSFVHEMGRYETRGLFKAPRWVSL